MLKLALKLAHGTPKRAQRRLIRRVVRLHAARLSQVTLKLNLIAPFRQSTQIPKKLIPSPVNFKLDPIG
jgi:hypothetical protein